MKGILVAIIRLHKGEKDVQLRLDTSDDEFDRYIANFSRVQNLKKALFGFDSEGYLYLFGKSQIRKPDDDCYVKYSPVDGSPTVTCELPTDLRLYA